MARPRKPTALKLVTGTQRADRATSGEPEPMLVTQEQASTPPAHLHERSAAVWREVAPMLRSIQLLTVADLIAKLTGSQEINPTTRRSADKPSADEPSADEPSADKPSADKPSADIPSADIPRADADDPDITMPIRATRMRLSAALSSSRWAASLHWTRGREPMSSVPNRLARLLMQLLMMMLPISARASCSSSVM